MIAKITRKLTISFNALVIVLALLGFATVPAHKVSAAATINVTSTADVEQNDGVCTLREAITAAVTDTGAGGGECDAGSGDDTINVPAGTYTLTANLPVIESYLSVFQGLSIVGAGSDATIIDGANLYNGLNFYLTDQNASLSGIRQINSPSAIGMEAKNCTINDVIMSQGEGHSVVHCTDSINIGQVQMLDYTGSTIGMEINGESIAAVAIQDLRIANNVPSSNSDKPALQISGGSTVVLNRAEISGSGCANCLFGGLVISASPGATYQVRNTTISGNQSFIGGAFVQTQGANIEFTNTTIANNTGSSGGNFQAAGLMYFDQGGSTFTLQNTLLSNNKTDTDQPQNCFIGSIPNFGDSSTPSSLGNNLSSDATCNAALTQTTDLKNTNAHLGALSDNGGYVRTHALLASSPAADGGATIAGLTTDARGIARPQCDAYDIGAYEYNGDCSVLGTTTDNTGGGNGASSNGGGSSEASKATVPKVPDTGFYLIMNNPVFVILVTLVSSIGLLVISSRFSEA